MKLSGQIKGSGKLGNIVAVQTGGECIAREYKATVANPSTPAQVNQRAIMKLMSQVAASVAPVLAIPKQGLKSSRNLFISKNYGLASANDGAVQLTIENLQLTLSNTGLPAIEAERITGNKISVKLTSAANLVADRIVYILFSKSISNTLTYEQSIVVSDPGADNLFPGELDDVSGDAVLYAYGMKDASASAHASYGNYAVSTGEDVARLIMQRKLSTADYSLTQTRGCEIFAGETGGNTPGPGQYGVYLTTSGPGSVSGAGMYPAGATAVVTAQADEGCVFIGWRNNGQSNLFAYTPVLILPVNRQYDLVAVFNNPQSPSGGEPGVPSVNPMPYAYAEVKIDGRTVDVSSGRVEISTSFDSIGISNVGEGQHFTFVPEGHVLGDSACIGLAPEGIPNEDYGFEATGCKTGAIYLDSQVFFYIVAEDFGCEASVEHHIPDGKEWNGLEPIGDSLVSPIPVDIISTIAVVNVEGKDISSISLYDGTTRIPLVKDGETDWVATDLGNLHYPFWIEINDLNWKNVVFYDGE